MTAPLAFVDVETTGLDPDRHVPWEVALALYDPAARRVLHTWVWQLPILSELADPDALAIGRYHDRRWADEDLTSRADFAEQFELLVHGCPLVGANPAFDADFLGRLLRVTMRRPSWHYRPVDLEAMMVGWFHGRQKYEELRWAPEHPPLPEAAAVWPWSSTKLSEALGVPRDPATMHTALGDVLWCVALYERLTA